MRDLATILRKEIQGEILTDVVSRGIYATDASNYEIFPRAVAVPAGIADVLRILTIARNENVPVIPRGGGTSLAGQTTGDGIVIDFSKHLNRVLSIDPERRTARVQPGLVRDELNLALAPYGLHFAPDPATGNRANIGGMIGNNSAGTRSIVFGKTVDHVLGTKIALSDGAVLDLHRITRAEYDGLGDGAPGGDRRAELLGALKRIVERDRDEIEARFPKVMRRVQGYNLDELLDPGDWNPAKIFVGSEGTLGLLLEAEINLEPVPRFPSMCVPQFRSLMDAIRAVEGILRHEPSCVEILDEVVIRLAHENLTTAPLVDFLDGSPPAALIVEFFGSSAEDAEERARALAKELITQGIATSCPIRLDAGAMSRVWEVRKHGLGLMLGIKGDKKPIPFIEDAAVPVAVLPEYIEQVLAICEENETKVALYAHASVGLLHVRPILDLKRQQDIDRMKRIADRTFALVKQYGGSWSGEHGDGLARSPWLREFFGDRIYETLREVKTLFDPAGIMNPGKIVDAGPIEDHLRFGAEYKAAPLDEAFDYREDRTFLGAIEMCTGVGACRKTIGGTMCPSYRATRDEEHSTRGRANALRLALTGRIPGGLANRDLQNALDLCLSCKACKSECPSNVDLAKLKSEYLHQLDLAGGLGWRKKMLADAPIRNRSLAGHWARGLLMNPFTESIAKRVFGMHPGRRLPRPAARSFAQWFDTRSPDTGVRRRAGDRTPRERVVLFDDCFLHGYEPEVGIRATEAIEAMG
ncbi:MAG: FAD-binding oxidoreductase, partial [Gemmatimonadetes bacterium]|nr:FAD-binding oxidoreductase [Gemmatimonadota bacterium]